MSAPCPFCRTLVQPVAAPGGLMCPACRNTGQPVGAWPSAAPQYGGYPGGYPQAYGSQYPPQRTNGLAIASMVCGIVGIFPLYILGIALGPTAIVLGSLGLKKIKLDPTQKGSGMAIAGIVCGAVATLIGLIIVVAMATVFARLSRYS